MGTLCTSSSSDWLNDVIQQAALSICNCRGIPHGTDLPDKLFEIAPSEWKDGEVGDLTVGEATLPISFSGLADSLIPSCITISCYTYIGQQKFNIMSKNIFLS